MNYQMMNDMSSGSPGFTKKGWRAAMAMICAIERPQLQEDTYLAISGRTVVLSGGYTKETS